MQTIQTSKCDRRIEYLCGYSLAEHVTINNAEQTAMKQNIFPIVNTKNVNYVQILLRDVLMNFLLLYLLLMFGSSLNFFISHTFFHWECFIFLVLYTLMFNNYLIIPHISQAHVSRCKCDEFRWTEEDHSHFVRISVDFQRILSHFIFCSDIQTQIKVFSMIWIIFLFNRFSSRTFLNGSK